MQVSKHLFSCGKLVKDQVDAIVNVVNTASRTTTAAAKTAATTTTAAAKTATTATTAAAKTATTGARLALAAEAPLIGLNVVLLAFSIYDIVDASLEIHREKKSKGGDLLRQVAAKLDEIIEENVTYSCKKVSV